MKEISKLLITRIGFGSEEVRNQVAGHLDSRTYRTNYQDQRINLDVASLVSGHDGEDALIRKLNDVGTNADPNANVALPLETLEQIAALPDVVSLRVEQRRLAELLRRKYGSISRALASDDSLTTYLGVKRAHRTRKEFCKARMRSQLRRDFFARKNAALIEAQLDSKDVRRTLRTEQNSSTPSIPERAALASLIGAKDMRSVSMRAHRAAAIQAMEDLCCRVELRRKAEKPGNNPLGVSAENLTRSNQERSISMKCHCLQCLFCLGDERLNWKDRTRIFSQQYTLGRHVEHHINAIKAGAKMNCPHLICMAQGLIVNNVEHLKNHACREHGIRLQTY